MLFKVGEIKKKKEVSSWTSHVPNSKEKDTVMSFRGNNYGCHTGIYVQYSVLLLSILIDKQYPDHAFLQFDRGLFFFYS